MEVLISFLVVICTVLIGLGTGFTIVAISRWIDRKPEKAEKYRQKQFEKLLKRFPGSPCKVVSLSTRLLSTHRKIKMKRIKSHSIIVDKELMKSLIEQVDDDNKSYKELAQIERELAERPVFAVIDRDGSSRNYPSGGLSLRELLLKYDVDYIRVKEPHP